MHNKLNKSKTHIFTSPKSHPQGLLGCCSEIYSFMKNHDYTLSINKICEILDCSYQFCHDYILPEVDNIILNFRIKKSLSDLNYLPTYIDNSLYYFSSTSFYNFILKHCSASRMAHVLIFDEPQQLLLDSNTKKHTEAFLSANSLAAYQLSKAQLNKFKSWGLKDTLIELGFENVDFLLGPKSGNLSGLTKNIISHKLAMSWYKMSSYDCYIESIPEFFLSMSSICKDQNYSREMGYREIFQRGLIKYSMFNGKLIRYSKNAWDNSRKIGVVALSHDDYLTWLDGTKLTRKF